MYGDFTTDMGDQSTDMGDVTDMGEEMSSTDMGGESISESSEQPNDDPKTVHPKPGTTPENAVEYSPCPETEPKTILPETEPSSSNPEGEGPPKPPEGWRPGGPESGW